MLYSLIEIMNNVVINNVSRVLAILFITVFSITINAAVRILIIIIYLISIDTINQMYVCSMTKNRLEIYFEFS